MPGRYDAPGVYVEELPSAVKPIAGVGTSTAAFIGILPDTITLPLDRVVGELVGVVGEPAQPLKLRYQPAPGTVEVTVNSKSFDAGGKPFAATVAAQVLTITPAPKKGDAVTASYLVIETRAPAPALEPVPCTSYGDFERAFGGLTDVSRQNILAHAVYGFFANGGTRCYVVRIRAETSLTAALSRLAAIDEIAIVAAPGLVAARDPLITHCQSPDLQDRFAILDGEQGVAGDLSPAVVYRNSVANTMGPTSAYAAVYYPWLKVFDRAKKLVDPAGDGLTVVPPSGHVAGVYARVDTQRGVHKAPANEALLGVLDLDRRVSKVEQGLLNPEGINCIRDLNGAIRIWGARTLSTDSSWTYVSVRRLFLYLRESIDEGLQWTVFEPNDAALWAKIRRNVSAFLTRVWRDGALFGATPQEAFYVRCDAGTNPPELREVGQVVTEIGVAVTRPAEFVIFRLSQWAGPQK
jgi:hypothetical protein